MTALLHIARRATKLRHLTIPVDIKDMGSLHFEEVRSREHPLSSLEVDVPLRGSNPDRVLRPALEMLFPALQSWKIRTMYSSTTYIRGC